MNDKPAITDAADQPVTVVVSRQLVKGRESDYKQWAAQVSEVSEKFPGHLGATLQGPSADNEYHVIFRFDTVEHLRQWETSKERAEWVAKLGGVVEGEVRVQHYTGLESLFSSAAVSVQKYKMALVLTAIVFSMLLILRPIVGSLLPSLPAIAQLFITVVIQVTAMTYLVMPPVTRLLNNWLHE